MNYTENNNPIMKTQVETFVIEETVELIYDNEKLEQWNTQVEQLGLKGQQKIVSPEKSPIPFMFMNENTKAIFSTLCPRKVAVQEFDKTPIPVEILDLVALATRENHFQKIEIWFDEKTPDPACVGITGHWGEMSWYSDSNKTITDMKFKTQKEVEDAGGKHASFYPKDYYLLGKWADVKHSMEELKEMAKKRFIAESKAKYSQEIKAAQRNLDDLDSEAVTKFGA